MLARYASKATRARGSGENDRKQLRFPSRRLVYAKRRTNAQTGEVEQKGRSYYLDIWGYLQRWAFRTLNDLQGAGYAPPTHSQLSALFEARIRERGRTWTRYDGKAVGLELETVETMADDAATAALRDWSETWIAGRREAGRKGGQRSSRPRSWDDDDLAVLALFAHLPAREAFVRYNAGRAKARSRATLYRMLGDLAGDAPREALEQPVEAWDDPSAVVVATTLEEAIERMRAEDVARAAELDLVAGLSL